jgi:catechol 2,3-dioxygenase-like lactoylglutathione lyase family enzyme
MDGRAIDHVNIKIPEDRVDDAVEFYHETLGFEPEQLDAYREGERTLFSFRLSPSAVIHVRPVDPEEFVDPTGDNYDHFAIVLDADIDEIKDALADGDVDIRRTSNPLGATGRNPAAYVSDPFGFVIELKAGREA